MYALTKNVMLVGLGLQRSESGHSKILHKINWHLDRTHPSSAYSIGWLTLALWALHVCGSHDVNPVVIWLCIVCIVLFLYCIVLVYLFYVSGVAYATSTFGAYVRHQQHTFKYYISFEFCRMCACACRHEKNLIRCQHHRHHPTPTSPDFD